jgi:hypothetical protein
VSECWKLFTVPSHGISSLLFTPQIHHDQFLPQRQVIDEHPSDRTVGTLHDGQYLIITSPSLPPPPPPLSFLIHSTQLCPS